MLLFFSSPFYPWTIIWIEGEVVADGGREVNPTRDVQISCNVT